MKYIKTYENIQAESQAEPQVGEYCVANCPDIFPDKIQKFFLNNVGKIRRKELSIDGTDIDNEYEVEIYDDSYVFVVDYENRIPWDDEYNTSKLQNYTHLFYGDHIIFHSKNKENVIDFIVASKYNL